MPIRPENKSRYPANWQEIRASILKRANNRCEFCGVEIDKEYYDAAVKRFKTHTAQLKINF